MASRSLGTLTLDLIAKTGGFVAGMSAAERAADKSGKKMQRELNKLKKEAIDLGEKGALAFTALSAAALALAVDTAKTANEITRLAALSGETVEGFQKSAAGAKALGIEQDKLADIFKDTSDKVGDFLQSGGGALADYFENIAPKIGQTAEQFRNLSGSQALQLYVDGLEQANLSQNEMTFFMEAIASDATLLLPLLKNGGEAFKVFGEEAAKAGAILDDDLIKNSEDFQAVLLILEQQSKGLKNTISAELIPVFTDFGIMLANIDTDGEKAADSANLLTDSIKVVAKVAVGAVAAFDLWSKAVAGYLAVASNIPKGFDAVSAALDVVGSDLDDSARKWAEYFNEIDSAGNRQGSSPVDDQVKSISDLLAAQRELNEGGETSLDGKKRIQLEKDLEALQESFLTEQELLLEKYEAELQIIENARNAKLELEGTYDELGIQAKERYEKSLTEIESKAAKARLKATQGALGNLSTLMNTESRKLFEVGKAAALANSVISGHEAAVEAYKGGLKVSGGNPVVGAAFATASLAATGAQIQSIQSQSFGGGASSSGGSVTQAINADSEQVAAAPANETQGDRNVFIQGIDPDQLFSGEAVLDLINNELSNGGRFITS